MSEPYVGEIRLFAGNFAPRGWAFCDGQLLAVSQNDALFSLLGTIYGGDGQTTFGLPDLRGRAPLHAGQGPGLPSYTLGASGGTDSPSPAATAAATSSVSIARGIASSVSDTPVAAASGGRHPTLALHFIIALFGIYPSTV
jgi:microcystin-dependent protein